MWCDASVTSGLLKHKVAQWWACDFSGPTHSIAIPKSGLERPEMGSILALFGSLFSNPDARVPVTSASLCFQALQLDTAKEQF